MINCNSLISPIEMFFKIKYKSVLPIICTVFSDMHVPFAVVVIVAVDWRVVVVIFWAVVVIFWVVDFIVSEISE